MIIVGILSAALAALAVPLTASSYQAQGLVAQTSVKKRPCSNKKQKVFVLCKPRAGIWTGTATQQTPSGPQSSPFGFTVQRKGAKRIGTRVTDVDFDIPWFCGDEIWPQRGKFPLSASVATDKVTGLFSLHGRIEQVGGEQVREGDLYGDFLSKRRAKGTLEGTWRAAQIREETPSGTTIRECDLTLRQVTWTASAAG